MLYQFHHEQTKKRPGSVHATYLVGGVQRVTDLVSTNGAQKVEDQDAHMPSSPYMSSSMPHQDGTEEEPTVRSITLVTEEQLEEAKAQYAAVHSVHIYSLEPIIIQNLQLLSDCTRAISVSCADEDLLVAGKQYGVIQNTRVKRRIGRRPHIPVPTLASTKPALKSALPSQHTRKLSTKIEKQASHASEGGKEASSADSGSDLTSQQPKRTTKKATGKPTGPRREQSDLFKAFAKPKAKLNRDDTGSSVGDLPAPPVAQLPGESSVPEDEPMQDASEDEQEADFIDNTAAAAKSNRKSKAEREEQLRNMMEQEGMYLFQSSNSSPDANPPPDEPMPFPDDPPDSADNSEPIDALALADSQPSETTVNISDGRRRGRRKVMKKKTTKDEEGYLGTFPKIIKPIPTYTLPSFEL
ncbi:MAG: hypothetical protein LQ347_002916 [Umbilicaria vellea]|nr:MAG: hypothetical protein LQ347_002916 [Umbilicaria vellea]